MEEKKRGTVFELDGIPRPHESLPMALQHLVAMIVGCITPSIIISGVAKLDAQQSVMLIQSGLFISGVATFMQLFPIFGRVGSKLPMIMGVSFAYIPTMVSITNQFDIATLLGAQLIGGVVAIVFGLFLKPMRKLFPPIISGTVVFTIGLSLYPIAIRYMAGGQASEAFGSGMNWLIAFITLAVVIFFSYFTKGILKLASILIGVAVGYVVALVFNMVDFSGLQSASAFALPKIMPYGMKFETTAIVSLVIMYIVNSVQAIGDISATTSGSMDRLPTDKELSGGIIGNGVASVLGASIGALPTATFSQNVGIVVTTRVINRFTLGITAGFILLASFFPWFGALLNTIPQCVLGGATLSVFASITMTGMRLICQGGLTPRNMSIVGIAVALGVGVTSVPESLALAPAWVQSVFGSSSVVISTLVGILLNIILPKEKAEKVEADNAKKAEPEVTTE